MKYTKHLLESFYNPEFCGTISGAHVAHKNENLETKDAIKFYFVLDGEVIKDVKYQACGSVVLFASLSAISNLILNKTIADARLITEKQVIMEIKQVNRCDYATISFAIESLNKALDFATKKLEKGIANGDRQIKSKKLHTAKNISIYDEDSKPVIEEVVIKPIKKKEAKKKLAKDSLIVLEQEEDLYVEEQTETIPEKVLPLPIMQEVVQAVPTKIEVRVVEDEEELAKSDIMEEQTKVGSLEIVATKEEPKKEEKTNFSLSKINSHKHPLFDSSIGGDDNMVDEIDSITAKLTDAITKLNFKFDVDEDE